MDTTNAISGAHVDTAVQAGEVGQVVVGEQTVNGPQFNGSNMSVQYVTGGEFNGNVMNFGGHRAG
ncbi:hypothetical protein [Kitasatospora sp. NPDC088134]|uniref:hypothetical protein n=1 Tax=Kitasatospora sp. NPDC088134 TaxID=3364071 RepID=UPI003827B209